MEMPICEVCNKNVSIGVACVPAVPYSAAYCLECLEADAHPWWILVANTACCGGLEYTADWWKLMVEDTCKHLGKTMEQFLKDVEISLKEEREFLEKENAILT